MAGLIKMRRDVVGDSNFVALELTADWASRRLRRRSRGAGRVIGGQLIFGSGAVVAAAPFASAALFRLLLFDIGIETDLLRRGILVLAISDVAAAISPATFEWTGRGDVAVLLLAVMARGCLGPSSEEAGATGLARG